jgi:acyl-CoA thioesterase FadM
VRYGEVDMQRVVFNAHYLAYCDDAVERWGSTSFDPGFTGRVGGRPVFRAVITYVGVRFGTKEKAPPPPEVRARLSDAPGPEPPARLSDAPGPS